MDLLLPNIALLLWTSFWFINLVFVIVAFISLLNNKNFDSSDRFTFAIGIILLPLVGSITYFYVARKRKKYRAA